MVDRAATEWRLLPRAEGELSPNFQLDAKLIKTDGGSWQREESKD